MLFRVKLVRPVPAETHRRDVFQKKARIWKLVHEPCHYAPLSMRGYNIWTVRNHGRARQDERAYRQVCGQRGRNVTMALAVSSVNGLVFHSVYIGGMNAPRFNDFLAQTRQNLEPDEEVIFIPAANTELEMLLAYSPFLNIVEQAISSLKAAIKGDVSRPEI